jgi:glycerol-3-phosphate acyltransferase PlsY
MELQRLLVVGVLSYLIGAIPFGWLIGKANKIDLREEGSRGIGATNVGRVLGRRWALLTFLLDTLKGVAIVIIAQKLGLDLVWAIRMGLVGAIGHCFPIVLGGKGGKAVATSLGVLLASQWQVGLIAFLVWLVVVLPTRLVAVASLFAAVSLIVMEWVWRVQLDPRPVCWIFTGIAILVIVMHIPNIKRLVKGEEKRFEFGGGKSHGV